MENEESKLVEKKGVYVVLYEIMDGIPRYVIFNRAKDWVGWELLKGGVEENEDFADTAKREVLEEAGLTVEVKESQHGGVFYSEKEGVKRKHVMKAFFAKGDSSQVVLSDEHSGHKSLELDSAVNLLSFDNIKELLQKIDGEIREHENL